MLSKDLYVPVICLLKHTEKAKIKWGLSFNIVKGTGIFSLTLSVKWWSEHTYIQ